MTGVAWSKPAVAVGDFVVLAGETFAAMFRPPFAWRELIEQIWFVARVSIVPTLVLSIPYTVLIVFTLNIVLIEVGAGDLSGAGAALASVTQVGPVVTAIVVSGAGATAMCADLGARTIREEIDAMKVIGVNPVQALVVPRVIAATFVALMLYSVVAVVGLTGSYFFVVYVQNVTPGAFAAGTDAADRPAAGDRLARQGAAVRSVRGPDRVLQGVARRWRSDGGRQRRQRNRGVRLHGAVPHQHPGHRVRREGGAVTVRRRRLRHSSVRRRRRRSARTRRLGEQTAFYGQALAATADAVRRYPGEVLRLIAGMGMGTGALAVIGGTVVIVGFLTLSTGALIAVQGYNTLSNVGIEALTGFLGAFLNVRFIAPATAGVALAATIGAGATAQLGAMRINEEIDALEVMGIRPVTYLASTRIVAGVIAVIPIYTVAVLMSFLATRFGTTVIYGQSRGVYDHYFSTFLQPTDLLWSFIEALSMAAAVMAVHTYYGFTATGGPAGVGEAVGRAVRMSITAGVFILLTITLSVYGQSGNFHLSG